ncbi:hypothetical protein CDAR_196291 [Caerostris darwini]|uniref:Uncharacterized protein n=1 Tax=Caerostris darwini TaxID=1538125 RepID=A0AAV4PWF4_9ARAC|nr:hypothetical protein CDAR_196291 [Caerostris darwini]
MSRCYGHTMVQHTPKWTEEQGVFRLNVLINSLEWTLDSYKVSMSSGLHRACTLFEILFSNDIYLEKSGFFQTAEVQFNICRIGDLLGDQKGIRVIEKLENFFCPSSSMDSAPCEFEI